jgi:hypothetical protein
MIRGSDVIPGEYLALFGQYFQSRSAQLEDRVPVSPLDEIFSVQQYPGDPFPVGGSFAAPGPVMTDTLMTVLADAHGVGPGGEIRYVGDPELFVEAQNRKENGTCVMRDFGLLNQVCADVTGGAGTWGICLAEIGKQCLTATGG